MSTSEAIARNLYAELLLVISEINEEEWTRIMGQVNRDGDSSAWTKCSARETP
jgi:hypothetical protein